MKRSITLYKSIALNDKHFQKEFIDGHYKDLKILKLKPKTSTKITTHKNNEIIYIGKGTAEVHAYGQKFNLNKSDLIHISKGILHYITNSGKNSLVLIASC